MSAVLARTRWSTAEYHSNDDPNTRFVEQVLAAQRTGLTCLPDKLGLFTHDYQQLIPGHTASTTEQGQLRQQLLELRRDEWQDLVNLLLQHRAHRHASERLMAHIVAAACLGSEHLWRDLGMQSRDQLRQLLTHNFPSLVQHNDRDMRWKKFFYKQLCEQEGGYVCRSPTCEQCPTYHDCFGDES